MQALPILVVSRHFVTMGQQETLQASKALHKLIHRTIGISMSESNRKFKTLPKPKRLITSKTLSIADLDDSSDSEHEKIDVRDCFHDIAQFEKRLVKSNDKSCAKHSEYEMYGTDWSPEAAFLKKLPIDEHTKHGVLPHLKGLSLEKMNIGAVDADFEKHLTFLTKLDVSSNPLDKLHNVPRNVEELNAYNCNISCTAITHCVDLIHLGLGYNRLTSMPQVGAMNLVSLDLSFNDLENFTLFLTGLQGLSSSLRHLFVCGNPIAIHEYYRCNILHACSNLTVLDDLCISEDERVFCNEYHEGNPTAQLQVVIEKIEGLSDLLQFKSDVTSFRYAASVKLGDLDADTAMSEIVCVGNKTNFGTKEATTLAFPLSTDLRDAFQCTCSCDTKPTNLHIVDSLAVQIWIEECEQNEDPAMNEGWKMYRPTEIDNFISVSFPVSQFLQPQKLNLCATASVRLQQQAEVQIPTSFCPKLSTDETQGKQKQEMEPTTALAKIDIDMVLHSNDVK